MENSPGIDKRITVTDAQALGLLIAGATCLRLIFAQTGLGIDETYTVATSRNFHLSFFDHPPVAWWLSWLMQTIFHSDAPFIVRLPFIALSGVATWQVHRLTKLLFGSKAGLFAATAFVCAPALGMTSGTWVLPDGPLLVGLLAAAICLARLLFCGEAKGWLWLAAGFWGGFALLSKYHGVFLFLGTGLFILMTPSMRHWLKTIWPYLGGLIGLAVFSPALVWNDEHHWISFAFQSGRASQTHIHVLRPVLTLMGQAVFLTPWLWFGLVCAVVQAVKDDGLNRRKRFLLCMAMPQILLFTLVSMGSTSATLYHWAMPGYMFLLPLLGDWLARLHARRPVFVERIVRASVSFVAILVSTVTLLWFLPFKDLPVAKDPLAAMRPLDGFNAYLEAEKLSAANLIVAPTKWYLAGQFDYALKGQSRVTCFCEDAREYRIIAPLNDMTGKDFIIPMPMKNAEKSGQDLIPFFAHIDRLKDFTVMRGNGVLEKFAVFYGKDLKRAPFGTE
ncbi:MAG: glycosyltransferase family 39 protein [Alphaproteobacteria bacterium]|nr:glycosyltransferase family 39 protein [Alphaproteobacteria bacterium]